MASRSILVSPEGRVVCSRAVANARRLDQYALGKVLIIGSVGVMALHVVSLGMRLALQPEDDLVSEVLGFFDAGTERALVAWWTGALLVVASAGAAVVGQVAAADRMPGREVLSWRVLAVLFALLSLDEIASLHERGARLTAALLDAESPWRRFGWLLPAAVVLIISIPLLVVTFRSLPARPRKWVVVGLVVSIAGALGMELVNVILTGAMPGSPWRHVVHTIEEMAEIAGILIVLSGVSLAIQVGDGNGLSVGYNGSAGAN